jgi:predicted amidohydrolase
VLADAGPDVGVITAEIDMNKVTEARHKVPALTHDATFKVNRGEINKKII